MQHPQLQSLNSPLASCPPHTSGGCVLHARTVRHHLHVQSPQLLLLLLLWAPRTVATIHIDTNFAAAASAPAHSTPQSHVRRLRLLRLRDPPSAPSPLPATEVFHRRPDTAPAPCQQMTCCRPEHQVCVAHTHIAPQKCTLSCSAPPAPDLQLSHVSNPSSTLSHHFAVAGVDADAVVPVAAACYHA